MVPLAFRHHIISKTSRDEHHNAAISLYLWHHFPLLANKNWDPRKLEWMWRCVGEMKSDRLTYVRIHIVEIKRFLRIYYFRCGISYTSKDDIFISTCPACVVEHLRVNSSRSKSYSESRIYITRCETSCDVTENSELVYNSMLLIYEKRTSMPYGAVHRYTNYMYEKGTVQKTSVKQNKIYSS